MSEEDDAWALSWLADHPSIEECASARVTINKVTHRAVLQSSATQSYGANWRTLCGSHLLWIREGRFALAGWPDQRFDFSSENVDCLCCIPAGG